MRSAIIAQTVYQCMAGSKAPRREVEDFMPKFQTITVAQSAREMQQRILECVGNKAFIKKDAS